jgi:hypothetical protein
VFKRRLISGELSGGMGEEASNYMENAASVDVFVFLALQPIVIVFSQPGSGI